MKIVVISAIWCPSCLILNKQLKKIKKQYNINIIKYDYDFDSDEIEKYKVKKILPVIIIEDKDKEIGRLKGEKTYEEIVSFLKEYDLI